MTPRIRQSLVWHDGPMLVLADEGGRSWLLGLVVGENCPGVFRWAFAEVSFEEARSAVSGEPVLRKVFSENPVRLYDEGPGGLVPADAPMLLDEDLPDADAALDLLPDARARALALLEAGLDAAPVAPPAQPVPGGMNDAAPSAPARVLVLLASLHTDWSAEGGEVEIYDDDATTDLAVAGVFPDTEEGAAQLARAASEALDTRPEPEDDDGPDPVARVRISCAELGGAVVLEGSTAWDVEPGWSEEEILSEIRSARKEGR